jgi:hypothetical protein
MRDTLSASETAQLVGVSRARVYQRLDGWDLQSRAIASVAEPSRHAYTGVARRVPVAAALAWRTERLAAGAPVGPLPDWLAVRTSEPAAPVTVDAPDDAPAPIGLPSLRPF